MRVGLRVLTVVAIGGLLWVAWTALSVWLSFRSIDRIEVDLEGAREAIESLRVQDRPPPPPLEPDPVEIDPIGPPSPTALTQTTTTTPAPPEPPDIDGDQIPYNPEFSSSPAVPDEAFESFLIIGSDARADRAGTRADVIILALLPTDGSSPILVSLPRDLWLDIPCWEKPNRINAALNGCGDAASGPELLALTVADFTGIQPDHFALFDFEDFQRVIDAFGGIEICVDYPVREKRLALPAGCSTADGATSLLWVRSRRTEEFVDGEWRRMSGVNDITRNERQQDVLLQILASVRSLDTFTSLIDIVDSIADAVTIDDGISLGSAIGLAWDLRDVAPRSIIRLKIPVRHFTTDGGARVLLAKERFSDLLAEVWPASP